MMRAFFFAVLSLAVLTGCKTSYRWAGTVPADKRAICVPVFRNESDVTELGAIVSRQISREIQREGTFRLATPAEAVVEVQGVVRSAESSYEGGARRIGHRYSDYSLKVRAEVSVIDRSSGKVLIDNRLYATETPFAATQDLMTGRRNASGRAAEELSRQIVDDLLATQW